MASRASKGNGTVTPITFTPVNAGSAGAYGVGGSWFGPGIPMRPQAPKDVKGRQWDFPSAYNIVTQPRAYEPIGFPTLRAFADSYDLLRLVIETRKDQMEKLRWNIIPRNGKKMGASGVLKNKVDAAVSLFRKPDRRHSWNIWLRMVLEDLFVLDAATLFRRRTRGGSLYALEPLDGGTIKRLIDGNGHTPEYPLAAYQQVLKGMPAIDYTVQDLAYCPRNVRTNRVYGYSPVEQIIMTVNIALRRQVFQLNYFTEGNMPEALIGVPETWTPDQIRTFQEWFDNILAGNLAEKRKARFVPNAVGKTYIPTKETELFGAAEEWLARVTCYALSISPQPFIKMMNRATADSAQETSLSEGLLPIKMWLKNLIDDILAEDMDSADLEFVWADEDELDPEKRQRIISGYLKDGLITVNEGRVEAGREPYPDAVFDKPMFLTNNGLSPLIAEPADKTNTPEDDDDESGEEEEESSKKEIVKALLAQGLAKGHTPERMASIILELFEGDNS
jgi:hypothetical protein